MPRVEVRFDGVSRGAVASAAETRGAIKSVGDQAQKDEKRVSGFGATIRSALGLGAKAAAGGIVALGGAVAFAGFKFDNLKQQATIAFTTMLGSSSKANAFLGELQKFAARTPFEFPDLIRTSQRLLAMGFNAKQVVPTMTAIGDAVAGLGGSAETMDRVTTALGQIQAKGKASAEEMLQLTESGIPAWQMLADAIGKSVPEAMKLVSKGAIDSATTIAAVTTGMEKRFGGMMDKQSHTFGGLLSTVKDTFTQLAGTVMAPFFSMATKGLQRIVDVTSGPGFTAGLQHFGDILQNRVGPIVRQVAGYIVQGFEAVAPVVKRVAEGILSYYKAIAPPILALFKGIVAAVWPIVRGLADVLAETFQRIAKVINEHRAEIDRIVARISTALGLISKVLVAVVLPVIRFVFTEVLPRAIGFAITFLDKLTGAIAAIAGVFRKVWNAAAEATSRFFNWIVKTAIIVALKMVEPFSHLPKWMGGWARKAKEALEVELNGMVTSSAKAGTAAGDALGRNYYTAANAWMSAVGTLTGAPGAQIPGKGGQANVPRGASFISPLPKGAAKGIIGTPYAKGTTHDQADWQSGNAIDIAAAPHTPVLAVESGTIVKISGRDPDLGTVHTSSGKNLFGFGVTLQGHFNTYYYAHLDDVAVKVGQPVKKGQIIGYVAVWKSGGQAHVHFATKSGSPTGFASAPGATIGGGGKTTTPDTGSLPVPTDTTDYDALFGATGIGAGTGGTTKKPKKPALATARAIGNAKKLLEAELHDVNAVTKAGMGELVAGMAKKIRELEGHLHKGMTKEALATITDQIAGMRKKITQAFELQALGKEADGVLKTLSHAFDLAPAAEKSEAEVRSSVEKIAAQARRIKNQIAAAVRHGVSDADIKILKSKLAQVTEAAKAAVDEMQRIISAKRDALAGALGKVANYMMGAFDRVTAAHLRDMRKRVSAEIAGIQADANAKIRAIQQAGAGLTGEEKAYQDFVNSRAAEQAAKARAELLARQQALSVAPEGETAEEQKQRLADLADAAEAIRQDDLDSTERTLASAADASRRTRDEETQAQIDAIQTATDAAIAAAQERADAAEQAYQDERDAARTAFEEELAGLNTMLETGKISWDEYSQRVQALMLQYGLDPAWWNAQGQVVGSAVAAGITGPFLSAWAQAIADARKMLDDLRSAAAQPVVVPIDYGPPDPWMRNLPLHFATGGRVPGRFVGRQDTVMAQVTPGEEILDRSLGDDLRRFLAQGGGGSASPFAGATFYVLGTTEREVAQALKRIVDGAPSTPSYGSSRG